MARTSRQRPRARRIRLWLVAIVGICLVGFLYYRPVKAYLSVRRVLAARTAEVKALAREKAVLEGHLAVSASGETLLEEARRLGYVRPGEHLFIVRGVEQWLKTHRHSVPR